MKKLMMFLFHLFSPVLSVFCPTDIAGGVPNGKDGLVNVEDLIKILGYYGKQQSLGDINKNNIVDIDDVLFVLKDYGRKDCDKPKKLTIDFCKGNSKQLCRMKCPSKEMIQLPLQCKQDQCLFRVGNCCQFQCKQQSNSCGKYPCGCIQWNDGCNVCSIKQNQKTICTSRACIQKSPSFCMKYKNGKHCISPTSCKDKLLPGEIVIGRPFIQETEVLRSKGVPVISDWND